MSIKKLGVSVSCEHCNFIRSDNSDGFDVTVPVSIAETGVSGSVRLRCFVSPQSHKFEFISWDDANPDPSRVALTDETQHQIMSAFNLFAEQRICGNALLCPSEVVRIVKVYGSTGRLVRADKIGEGSGTR